MMCFLHAEFFREKKKIKRGASLPHRSFYSLVVRKDLVSYLTRLMRIQTELQETEVYQDRTQRIPGKQQKTKPAWFFKGKL